MPEWDRAFWLSRAFIEASLCLCNSMLNGELSSQYSTSRVVWHLARQGVELFLKAAIGAAVGSRLVPATHDLRRLAFEYRRIYSSLSFSLEFPSHFQVDTNLDLFPEDQDRFHATLDQRHRYPADRMGESFTTRETFDPLITQRELEKLDRDLKILESAYIRRVLKGLPPVT